MARGREAPTPLTSISLAIEGWPFSPSILLFTAVKVTSVVNSITSGPDPAVQPPVAVSVLADVIAFTRVQVVSSTTMVAASRDG